MAGPVTVKFEGGAELSAAIQSMVDDFDISKATIRNAMKRGLVQAGQITADVASQMAPDDPATGAPDLHTSIIASSRIKNNVGKAEFASVMSAGGSVAEASAALRGARREAGGQGSFAEAYVGVTGKANIYAHLVEFGTVHSSPQPFMRPAWSATKDRVLNSITGFVRGQFDKALARARAKALKKAS